MKLTTKTLPEGSTSAGRPFPRCIIRLTAVRSLSWGHRLLQKKGR